MRDREHGDDLPSNAINDHIRETTQLALPGVSAPGMQIRKVPDSVESFEVGCSKPIAKPAAFTIIMFDCIPQFSLSLGQDEDVYSTERRKVTL